MIACGATMSTDFPLYLCVISWNYASNYLCSKYLVLGYYFADNVGGSTI